ncbi:hypothetical protein DFH07DRAFT_1067612 [Mycena maculata]|uniref:Uncharacterized protein n=1 Tax=Mycena maculata TaxID=230809 RepID=A0AAD7MK94_9AGAR|nr:hypothetical protein DFH07DRAFT_1067612 [Mycena maculata]
MPQDRLWAKGACNRPEKAGGYIPEGSEKWPKDTEQLQEGTSFYVAGQPEEHDSAQRGIQEGRQRRGQREQRKGKHEGRKAVGVLAMGAQKRGAAQEKIHPIDELSAEKEKLIEACIPELKNIEKAKAFVT